MVIIIACYYVNQVITLIAQRLTKDMQIVWQCTLYTDWLWSRKPSCITFFTLL